MSASSWPRSNSFAAAARGPSWPQVVRIFARQRLMASIRLPGLCGGSCPGFAGAVCFLSGSIARGNLLRYIVLARIAFATSGGQYLERYLINGYMRRVLAHQHARSPQTQSGSWQPDRSRERWLRLLQSFLQCFWLQRYFGCPQGCHGQTSRSFWPLRFSPGALPWAYP